MVGVDVHVFFQPGQYPNWASKRLTNKLLAPSELFLFPLSESLSVSKFNQMCWCIKESIYKAFTEPSSPFEFAPKRILIQALDFNFPLFSGHATYHNQSFYFTGQLDELYCVSASCSKGFENMLMYTTWNAMHEEEASKKMMEWTQTLLQTSPLHLHHYPNGKPFLSAANRTFPVSISHHQHILAAAILLTSQVNT